ALTEYHLLPFPPPVHRSPLAPPKWTGDCPFDWAQNELLPAECAALRSITQDVVSCRVDSPGIHSKASTEVRLESSRQRADTARIRAHRSWSAPRACERTSQLGRPWRHRWPPRSIRW